MTFSRALMLGVNHPRVVTLLLILLTLMACLGLPKLQVDTGFSSMISDADPHKPVYDEVTREFGSDNRSIVYIRDDKLWSPTKLAALEELHYTLEGLDFVERVDDLFNLRSFSGAGGRLDSRMLMPEAPEDPETIEKIRIDALSNPLIAGNFISRDKNVTALLISVRKGQDDDRFNRRVNDALERVLTPARSIFQEVFQVGPPRINTELRAVLFEDLMLLGPLSALVLLVTILILLRSVFAALVPLITSVLSITWTFGVMGWAGIPLNILIAMLPTLVVVIGSTEDTHMISTYFQGLSEGEGDQRVPATRFMIKHLGVPLFLTVLTTGIGFASNIFSGIGLIRSFAIASTIAILANGVITILFVPMVLSAMGPYRSRLFRDKERVIGLPGLFVRMFGFANRHFPRLILVVTGILCAFFIYKAYGLYVTNDPLSYFRPDHPLVRDTHRLHRDLSGMKVFFITLASDEDKAFQEPENVQKLVTIQEFLEKQGIFDQSISMADYLSLVNREFHGGNPKEYRIPSTRELAAQYLLFFHRRDLESYVSSDFRRTNIVVRHDVTDSNALNRYIGELRDVVSEVAGGEMEAHVISENLMINAAADTLMIAQVKSLAVLLIVISLIMAAMFTSFRGGLIALIPNLIPIILMFGIMGLLGISLNPGTAMVAVIAIGIAIDGTIHLFSRYNDLCRRTSDYEGAVDASLKAEATPMVSTSLALTLGFGILVMSNFTVIAQFGALAAATMLFALFANLLVTPIIMSRVRLIGLSQILTLSMHKEILQESPLFHGMSDYQMRKAILISQLHEFDKGDLLVEQGGVGRNMYLILSGQAEVVRQSKGEVKRVAVLNAGEILGEVGYVGEIHRTADVRALTRVETLCFNYKKLKKDLKFFPHIVANLNFNISCVLGERLANVLEDLATRAEEDS